LIVPGIRNGTDYAGWNCRNILSNNSVGNNYQSIFGANITNTITLLPINIEIRDIHYANGYYIAVGFGGTTAADAVGNKIGGVNVAISVNRTTWTRHRIFTGMGLSITHDGSKWIATGEDIDPLKRVQYSTDNGTTWLPVILPVMDMSANIVTIINVPNTNKSLQLMDNSDNWIVTENNVLTTINKMFYSELEQLWMAVGEGPNDTIATSTDGITWMGKGMIFNIRGNSVHYKGGVWVAVGEDSNKQKILCFHPITVKIGRVRQVL